MALPAGRYGVTKNQLLKIKKLPMNTIKLIEEKCDNSVIGTVEDGATASQAYAVGEHFIREGAFCTCKQAISQGGSFTLNTNYTAGDVADILARKEIALSDVAVYPTGASLNASESYIYQQGNIVNFQIRIDDLVVNANTNICRIPLGVKATMPISISNSSNGNVILGYLTTGGYVCARSVISTAINININGTVII